MRLADLALSKGTTLAAVAARARVQPLFLKRVDEGVQPITPSVVKLVANVLGVDEVIVLAACPLTTKLDGPMHRKAIPPGFGEELPVAKLAPLKPPIVSPTIASKSLFLFLGPLEGGPDNNSVIERYVIDDAGAPTLAVSLLDSSDAYPGGLFGCVAGVLGTQGQLWVGGDDDTEVPLTFSVAPRTLDLNSDVYTWTGFSLQTFAKGSVDPATGRVWVTIADGFLYAFDPLNLLAGPLVFDLTVDAVTMVCGAMLFLDGFLYALCESTSGSSILKIDPRPSHEAIVASTASPAADINGLSFFMLEWVESAGKFYSNTDGGLNTWDPSTLAMVGHVGNSDPVTNMGGAYDASTDSFWMVQLDGVTPFHPVRLPRATGIPDFVGTGYDAQFSAPHPPALTDARVAFFPGQDNDTGERKLFWYTMDGTPALAGSITVGSGPNPTGRNNVTGGLVYG